VLLAPGEQRDRLTAGVFVPTGEDEPLAVLERAFELAVEAEPLQARVRKAQKTGELPTGPPEAVLAEAVAAGVLDEAEAELLRRAPELRREVVQVDEFSREEYLALGGETGMRASVASASGRVFGIDRGRFEVPEDFNAPLPEDVLRDFES
jgi:acyl-CoA dehydrogenase